MGVDALDPRPTLDEAGNVRGVRCTGCSYVTVQPNHRCPVCAQVLAPALFAPLGVVWASTVVRIPIPGREPPFGLAYVDLDAGPRVLAQVRGAPEPVEVGSRVTVVGVTSAGDLEVEAR